MRVIRIVDCIEYKGYQLKTSIPTTPKPLIVFVESRNQGKPGECNQRPARKKAEMKPQRSDLPRHITAAIISPGLSLANAAFPGNLVHLGTVVKISGDRLLPLAQCKQIPERARRTHPL